MNKTFYHKMITANDNVKDAFEGWTILEMGMTEKKDDSCGKNRSIEGGLTFILQKGELKKRVILGYTELGEWVEFEGFI